MTRYLAICVIVGSVYYAGCTTQPVEPPIGLPPCESPANITEEVWNNLELLRDAISTDALLYEECIDRLEGRIRLHDENL